MSHPKVAEVASRESGYNAAPTPMEPGCDCYNTASGERSRKPAVLTEPIWTSMS
jgi:hypothetical protein